MASWDESFDFVIVGSGGGGLVAALAAFDVGLKPVVIEKQQFVGGSTSMSGGVVWLPNNPLMQADGVPDSHAAGLDYLESVVGPADEGSSLERREAFLTEGVEMVSFIQRKGVELERCDGYSDYYDNRKGGNARGRAVECSPWDGKQLGEWYTRINPGLARGLRLAVKTNEMRYLTVYNRAPEAFAITARAVLRTYVSKLLGKDLFTNGMSLVGQLTKIIVDSGIPLWLDARVEDLIVEADRVVGVRVVRYGVPVLVRGSRGVLLAAGGLERNPEMRMKYTKDTQPNDGTHTMGNLGNTGEVLAAAIALSAKVEYMDEAVWDPSPRPEIAWSSLALARQYPHTIYVNKQGRRFCNESNSYVEVTRQMYANNATPAWLIFDDEYRRRHPWGFGLPTLRNLGSALPGRMPRQWVDKGWIKTAPTIEGLAKQIEIDPQALTSTLREWNTNAAAGRDPEFHRGESQYNKVLGDPGHKPNQAVGPIEKSPFYATEIFPGDVGTAGGVITDRYARVLDQENKPIPGLYATGKMSATVMGRTYPGAGASIANTTVFGCVAARHAALQPGERATS